MSRPDRRCNVCASSGVSAGSGHLWDAGHSAPCCVQARLKHSAQQLLAVQHSSCFQPVAKSLFPVFKIWHLVQSSKCLAFSHLKLMHRVEIVRHDATPSTYSTADSEQTPKVQKCGKDANARQQSARVKTFRFQFDLERQVRFFSYPPRIGTTPPVDGRQTRCRVNTWNRALSGRAAGDLSILLVCCISITRRTSPNGRR